jgi:hypothetical protein
VSKYPEFYAVLNVEGILRKNEPKNGESQQRFSPKSQEKTPF